MWRRWRRLRKAARARRGEADATIDDVHEMRIRAKRFRYAIDALGEVEPAAKAHAERLADLQDVLGDFNDAVDRRGVAARRGEKEQEPARMFVLGQLVMSQRVLVEQGLAEWADAWRPVRRRKRRLPGSSADNGERVPHGVTVRSHSASVLHSGQVEKMHDMTDVLGPPRDTSRSTAR